MIAVQQRMYPQRNSQRYLKYLSICLEIVYQTRRKRKIDTYANDALGSVIDVYCIESNYQIQL